MNFKVEKYASKLDIMEGIEKGTFVPKSDSLLLSIVLDNGNKGFLRKHIYSLTKNYDEFLPVAIFSGEVNYSISEIHNKILSYKSSKDSELAVLFNKIVMLLYFSVKYLNADKWKIYFNGYDNKGISEKEKHNLLESVINDICNMMGLSKINVVEYTYGMDNVYKKYYELVIYNPALNKIYIDEVIGKNWTHEEEKARQIIYHSIANNILNSMNTNSKLKSIFGVTDSRLQEYKNDKMVYFKDLENIANALDYYYNIHNGDFRLI